MSAPPHVTPPTDTLGHLAGRWRVRRTAEDLAAGESGRFEGAAEFTPDGGGLTHTEHGEFSRRGAHREARRAHSHGPGPDGTVLVAFPDGRPFHDLDLRTGRWRAVHGCPPDRYEGEFTILGPDRWRAVWRVTGPAKDPLLTTVHDRSR